MHGCSISPSNQETAGFIMDPTKINNDIDETSDDSVVNKTVTSSVEQPKNLIHITHSE